MTMSLSPVMSFPKGFAELKKSTLPYIYMRNIPFIFLQVQKSVVRGHHSYFKIGKPETQSEICLPWNIIYPLCRCSLTPCDLRGGGMYWICPIVKILCLILKNVSEYISKYNQVTQLNASIKCFGEITTPWD